MDELRVVVAMLTYLRPDDLRDAVPAALAQFDDLDADVSLVVVDNDPDASAMACADSFAHDRVRFVHEPTPGIAAARNRALDAASDSDLLVFIDDDERPEPGWLRSLVRTWRATGAAAVAGPVRSVFEVEPTPWIEAMAFRRLRHATGTELHAAATNNLLLDLEQVRAAGVRFDLDYGLSGGGDYLFTRQLHRAGRRIVWCDEAWVVDVVPAKRTTRRWAVQKTFRLANTAAIIELRFETGFLGRAARRGSFLLGGLVRAGAGTARWTFGALSRSVDHRARGARTAIRGVGMFTGACGYRYHEYRRAS